MGHSWLPAEMTVHASVSVGHALRGRHCSCQHEPGVIDTRPSPHRPGEAYEEAAAGLVYVDRDGVILALEGAAAALGLPADPGAAATTGRRLDDLVPAAASWLPILRRVLDAPGGTVALPRVCEGWRASVRALPALPGQPRCALVLLVDESTELQLERTRAHHQLITRATREAVWEHDSVTGKVWWNDRLFELFGLVPGTVVPSEALWSSHIHPDDRERVLGGLADLERSTGSSWSDSYRFVRADGSIGVAHDHSVVERDDQGRVRRLVGTMVDVTETLATERALRESESLFRQLTGTIRDVFWIGEPRARRVLYVSPAWESIWGVPGQALLDDPGVLLASVHPEDRERLAESMRTSHEETFDQTFRIVRPDGEVRWIHDRGYPMRDADGNIARVVGLATDITAERALEERLSHGGKLESIGRLAGGLAHDFNNMLTVMLSGAESAVRRLPPQHRALVDLEDVRAAAERAAELTRQLLVFARQQPVVPSLVDLNQLVVRMEGMLRRLIGEPIELALQLAEAQVNVWADAGQLEQVLVNLVVNARDAMPRGGVLTVRTRRVRVAGDLAPGGWDAPAGEHVQLSVADDGEGMPPEVLAHVFEPFFTTKGPGRGTGLGLATCYGMVKKAGGQIRVASERGRGTTFDILLPASSEQAHAGEALLSAPADGGHETILFVEDQTRLRNVAVRLLREAGYLVLSAPGGSEAIELAREHLGRIDLLVTDVIMPHMNGVELASALRTRQAGLRVLLSSGYPDDALPERRLPSGMAFLPKPYQGSTLLRTVRGLLDAPVDTAPLAGR
jgi:two-component system cell cycle sensor histidine kinase/response regulator CckA